MLAGGQDANDVASEVVAGVMAGKGRLALGWTRSRLEAELERQVSRQLRRVSSRREVGTVVSEWMVLPRDEAGKWRSVFEEVTGSMPDGYEEAARMGEAEEREQLREELDECLNGDRIARGVLRCMRKGVYRRREIAAELAVEAKAVTAARKRLEGKTRGLRRRLLSMSGSRFEDSCVNLKTD